MRHFILGSVALFGWVLSGSAAQAPPAVELGQSFTLMVGQHQQVGTQNLQITLRSLANGAGCLAPDDCSAMLFKGTLVLRLGEHAELKEVDQIITPVAPYTLPFGGYEIQLSDIRRRASEFTVTFTVAQATESASTRRPAIADETTSRQNIEISTPTETHHTTPPDAQPNKSLTGAQVSSGQIVSSKPTPLTIAYSMLSNSGWSMAFRSGVPLQKVEYRLKGESIWVDAQRSEQDYQAAFAELDEHSVIELRATTRDGHVSAPFSMPFDAMAAIHKQDMDILRQLPGSWVGYKGIYVYFSTVYGYACGLREVRYSINSNALDQRFPLPPCTLLHHGSMPSDDSEILKLPEKPNSVAVQVVFYDGSVSQIVVHKHEEY